MSTVAIEREAIHDALPVCLWKGNPNRLVSLWDMLQNYGFTLLGIGQYLTVTHTFDVLPDRISEALSVAGFWRFVKTTVSPTQKLASAQREDPAASFHDWLGMIIAICEACGLSQSHAYLGERLRMGHLRMGFEKNEAQFFTQLFVNELREAYYMWVPSDLAKLYNEPAIWFGREITDAFPSALKDSEEACRCLALARGTGAVFHALRAAEVALRALAIDRVVEYPDASVNTKQVGDLLSALDGKLADMRKADGRLWPSRDIKDAQIQFYHRAVVEFRDFNEAWRKHMAHAHDGAFYDPDIAKSILSHISQFMKVLAEKISEKTVTPLYWTAA